ncbi:MAG TPA: glycosyltransferase family 1 protein [Vicinamibacterales bacterium]
MRVLIDYRPALREPSGVGEYTHRLVQSLLAMRTTEPGLTLDITLFSSSWKDRLLPSPDRAGAAIVDRAVPVKLLNLLWHRFEWPAAETLARRPFDVVHSLHPLLMPTRSAAQVIMIHDLDFLSHPERTRAEIRRDYPALAQAHARRADRIMVPSQFTASEVQRQLGIPAERLAICPPGAPDWTPRTAVPSNGYVLFFGTLEPRKNVGGLLDAYERVLAASAMDAGAAPGSARPIPELILAGRATPEAADWLERLTHPPLKGFVRHLGYVDPAKRRALYENARVLVQPSFEEGFGMPVLEAMTVGVPVVAANRGSLPEVLGDAGPLVDPEQPAAMAAAISRVLNDERYATECSVRGVARAANFRWDRTARRVYDTYQEAIDFRRRRGQSA